ncbi:hypothetical protein [Acinetobacter beijerinckii]|uniref:hypothetical protein n=1 Tax=Acinetobacter beijerinckii TaxID=262668 RepID=UPI002406345E|nr:hypothetical protein [Acinetobacter beijerinckii]
MSTASRLFELQYSRFSIVLQFFIFLTILILSYQLLHPMLWLLSIGIMAFAWFKLFKQPSIIRFEYLDQHIWSFEFSDKNLAIQRLKITKIIDHKAYVSIHIADSSCKTYIIWWDQLSYLQRKNLKLLAKLI